jgi:AcrR family transcriptional regulator
MTEKTVRKRGRRKNPEAPSLDRATIVLAALAQIDEEGLEGFSLRSLATRLGVYPTAVYWYVQSRNELLAQVVGLILDKIQMQRNRRTWQSYIRDLFANFRSAIRAHPNVAPLIGTQLVSNTHGHPLFVEQLLSALSRGGLTGTELVGAYNSVIAAMVGFVTQEFASVPTDNPMEWQLAVQQRLLEIDRKQFPTLAENLPALSNHAFILRWQNGVESPLDASFSIFVDIVVAGIEALIAQSSEANAGPNVERVAT